MTDIADVVANVMIEAAERYERMAKQLREEAATRQGKRLPGRPKGSGKTDGQRTGLDDGPALGETL